MPGWKSGRPISASSRAGRSPGLHQAMSNSALSPQPSAFHAWWLAIRPKTLSVSLTPVMVGSSLAYAETGAVLWLPLLVALAAAMLIQIGTNLHNDVSDFERGADNAERIGPARATASGWLVPAVVRRAALACFGLAMLLGIYLVWHGGWPICCSGFAPLPPAGPILAGRARLLIAPWGSCSSGCFSGSGR